jgi:hypothetical protein
MLDFNCRLLERDIGGGFEFFDSNNQRLKLVSVSPFDLGGSLRKFGFESSPDVLLILFVLFEK